MICQNCGNNVKVWYEIRRMRMICFGAIAFRFGIKHIENVCANCINQSVVFFTDKKHSINAEMFEDIPSKEIPYHLRHGDVH
jgi:predicted site-specific integrase-resolvase